MAHVHHPTKSDEFDELLKNNQNKLVVVDFFATWCGPCKMIGPKVEKMAAEQHDVCFIKVDVDELSEVAEKYNVSAMPTFVFLKNGKQVLNFAGANEAKLAEAIASHNSTS